MSEPRDSLWKSRSSLVAFYDALFSQTKYNTLVPTCAAVGTTAVVLSDANEKRRYMAIFNDGDNANVYLGLGVTAVNNNGIRLNPAGGAYEINLLNLTLGTISAITKVASQNVTWVEGLE